MLVISGLREEYNVLKSTLLARQSPTAFVELHGLLNPSFSKACTTAGVITPTNQFNIIRSFLHKLIRKQSQQPINTQSWAWEVQQSCNIGHALSQCPLHNPSTICVRQQQPYASLICKLSILGLLYPGHWTGSIHHVVSDLSSFDVFTTLLLSFLTIERQFQTKLKFVQTDWGGEFETSLSFSHLSPLLMVSPILT
uniref:Uncharacterized protein n=1 Tax=Lactuca sativa TaxID=4236 RepID=A0A9R1XVT0_LACSA|nr:hypothetical protein LSAT_V11C100034910 [Lactuca sativa]